MFEKIIEKIILQFFGDYIENLDSNKLSLGLLSGSLSLKDIKIKSKKINEMKLPFKLLFGNIGELNMKIPWTNNFTTPTIIDISNIQITVKLISRTDWEFLDFYSFEAKLSYLNSFFEKKINELTEAMENKEKEKNNNNNYLDKIKIKILDNLHVNFKKIHFRIEDLNDYSKYSLGFTLDELLVINTNSNWEESFINRTENSNLNENIYKLLKIKNFGFYLNLNESKFLCNLKEDEDIHNKISLMDELYNNQEEAFLIKPISLTGKMIQYVNKMIEIKICLEKFEINFRKQQYDKIIYILNMVSQYQRFQLYKKESQKYNYYRPKIPIKENPKIWLKYAVRTLIKRKKYLQGKYDEFNINEFLLENYKSNFIDLYGKYKSNNNSCDNFSEEEKKKFSYIIELINLNILYQWSVTNIQKSFKEKKIKENSEPKINSFFSFFMKTDNPIVKLVELSEEEEKKLKELFDALEKEVKNELIKSVNKAKEITLKIEFKLKEGSFEFSNNGKKGEKENFGFSYKNLFFKLEQSDYVTNCETYLERFNIYMKTKHKDDSIQTSQITFEDKNYSKNNTYIWKLELKLYSTGAPLNLEINLKINSIDILYQQSLLERIMKFFFSNVKNIDEDLTNSAWEKITEFKEKTTTSIKSVITKKNIINIEIEPRRIIIPINKYNVKNSKLLVFEIGKFTVENIEPTQFYKERFLISFKSISIVYLQKYDDLNNSVNKFYIMKDLQYKLLASVSYENNKKKYKTSKYLLEMEIDKVNVNLTDSIFYSIILLPEILKPTEESEIWAILEENTLEIKKNCSVFCKLNKKDNIIITEGFKEYFGVLSGGYIYFFNNVNDSKFDNYFFIKNGIISNEKIDENNNIYECDIHNKYENITLQFFSKKKYEQFTMALIKRINEMGKEENNNIDVLTNNSKNVEEKKTEEEDDKEQNLINIKMKLDDIQCKLYDCKNEDDTELKYINIFTLILKKVTFNCEIKYFDKTVNLSIQSFKLLDELNKDSKELYELFSYVEEYNSKKPFINISIKLLDQLSPLYNNSDIEVNTYFGFVRCFWNSYRIRELLFFLSHNEIKKNKIKDSVILLPSQNAIKSIIYQGKQEININLLNEMLEEEKLNRKNCQKNKGKFWISVNVKFEKINLIWYNIINEKPLTKVLIGETNIDIKMTVDHFRIQGKLSSLEIYDITNYPYNDWKEETKILYFDNDYCIDFDFISKSLICPEINNKITTIVKVNFHNPILIYFHEFFFRAFNYFFDEFLGSFQAPPFIKEYNFKMNRIPIFKTINDFEFSDIKANFINPKIVIKPRKSFKECLILSVETFYIQNSYELTKGLILKNKDEERYYSVFNFDIQKLYIDYIFVNESKYNLLENTNLIFQLKLPAFMNDEENINPQENFDFCMHFNLIIKDSIKVNLRQDIYTFIIKIIDLNILYQDEIDDKYLYKNYFRQYYKKITLTSKEKTDESLIDFSRVKIHFQFKTSNIQIITIEPIKSTKICLFDFEELNIDFSKLFIGPNTINISLKNSNIQNLLEEKKQKIMSSNSSFDVRIVLDQNGEKNIILKIEGVKFILSLKILNIIQTFFIEGLPIYNENDIDLPNKFDPNIDNKPGMRINVDVKNILICFLTGTTELICLSTDFFLLLKKQKLIDCKRELVSSFNIYTFKANNLQDEDKIKELEKELIEDSKEIFSINISFYDISPFICQINDVFSDNLISNEKKRKLMKNFNVELYYQNLMKFNHPNQFITHSKLNIKTTDISCGLAYSDFVLFLKLFDWNFKVENSKEQNLMILNLTQKIQENIFKKQFTYSDISTILIEKGLIYSEITLPFIQIIFIDNHSNTYYPFISFSLEDVFIIDKQIETNIYEKKGICFLKINMYNYYAGVWEPIFERTELSFQNNTNSNNDNYINKLSVNVSNKEQIPTNINISDLGIAFLNKTLISWIEKYFELKNNYDEEIKKIILDQQKIISNHMIINNTGNTLKIYNEKKELITTIEPDDKYDLEYSFNVSLYERTLFHNQDKKKISFCFPELEINDIESNHIYLDQISIKKHYINYDKLKKKYKIIDNDLKDFEYIISYVKILDLKKTIIFYSPILFVNNLKKDIIVTVRKKNMEKKSIIKPKNTFAISYIYLDGNIEFKFKEDDQPQIFDIRTFLQNNFNQIEMRFDNLHISLIGNNKLYYNSKKKYIMINIISPYTIRNCLPFNLEILLKGEKFIILKNSSLNIYKITYNDTLIFDQIKCLDFLNDKKQDITIYFYKNEENKKNQILTNLRLKLYDAKKRSILLYYSIPQNTINNTIIFYPPGIIYNESMTELKLYYNNILENNEIPSQTQNSNIILVSPEEKDFIVEVKNSNNFISNKIPLNSIGLLTNIECINKKNRTYSFTSNSYNKGQKYEFTLETKLTPIAKDLDIFTTLSIIHPKHIITNKTNLPFYISYSEVSEPFLLETGKSLPLFLQSVSDSNILFRPIEEQENYKSGSKWNWSYPVNLESNNLITLQIISIDSSSKEKKYINIEKNIQDISTFFILTNTNINNCQILIDNNSKHISLKVHQADYEIGEENCDINSKKIFSWGNQNREDKTLNILFYEKKDIMQKYITKEIIFCQEENESGENINNYEIIKVDNKNYPLPFFRRYELNGNRFRMEIQNDGIRRIIRFIDLAERNDKNEKKGKKIFELNIKIEQIGISLITDNRFSNILKGKNYSHSYQRNEILYMTLKDVQSYFKEEIVNNKPNLISIQCKVKYCQIDNMINYLTQYPIILKPTNLTESAIQKNEQYFFNIVSSLTYLKDDNESHLKFNYLTYLIQSFEVSIDNDILESLINFITNISLELNTSINNLHPIFQKEKIQNENLYNEPNYYIEPFWSNSLNINNSNSHIFFKKLEISSIEMNISFKGGDSLQKFVTSNPILGSLISTISNMEKANLTLNGTLIENIQIPISNLFILILNQYKQSILTQILSIFGAIDILGNPINLFKSFGTGINDFFRKPIEGIVKGPLDGFEGAIEGGYSLIKNTIGGTFTATSKITNGISKGLLHLNNDEKYIKKLEQQKISQKPKNFIDGFGYGITSLSYGVYSGVKDVVEKPIEETQKKGFLGFGSGLFKGISGLVSKPVVGMLQLVSKTSEGIKNTFTNDDNNFIRKERKIRPFYGKYKFIKTYNEFHSYCLWFIYNNVEDFEKIIKHFYFVDAEYYLNKMGEGIFIVFGVKEFVFIDKKRKEIKLIINNSDVKSFELENDFCIKVNFKSGKMKENNFKIILNEGNKNGKLIYEKLKKLIE